MAAQSPSINPFSAITNFVDDIVGGFVATGGILDAGAAKAIAEAKNAHSPEQAAEILASAGVVSQAAQAAQAGASAAENPGNTANTLTGFLSDLTSASLWIRVGEGIVGLILIGIGLNAMLKGKPFQIVTGAAGTIGKAAMF